MSRIKAVFIIVSLLLLAYGCSKQVSDFSTPEKTFDTFYKSVASKNFKVFSNCFAPQNKQYNKDNLKIMFTKLTGGEIRITSHQIKSKDIISETQVDLTAEEHIQKNDLKWSSVFKINYQKNGNTWQVLSTESIEVKKL